MGQALSLPQIPGKWDSAHERKHSPSEVSHMAKKAVIGFLRQCHANSTSVVVLTWKSLFSWPPDRTLLIPCCPLFSPRHQILWRFLRKLTGQETGTTYGDAATAVSEGMGNRAPAQMRITLVQVSRQESGFPVPSLPLLAQEFSLGKRSTFWRATGHHYRWISVI